MHLHKYLIIRLKKHKLIKRVIFMGKAVTINDIAKQLNLSRNTVAKALNGQYVPPKTRTIVLEKARELNYKSLNFASEKLEEKKYRILLLSGRPLLNISYYVDIMKGVEHYCYNNNYELLQYTFNVKRDGFNGLSDYIKEAQIDGIVAIECFEKEFVIKLLNLDIPICFNDFTAYSVNTEKSFDLICSDDERAISNMIKYLHAQKPLKRVSFVGDYRHCLSFYERYMGMIRGANRININHLKEEDILNDDSSFDYGKPEVIKNEILNLKHKPDCFVCANDFVARTVVNALLSLNKKIPDDVIVTGFDDVAESSAFSPKITSFNVDKEFIGVQAVRSLIERIENPSIPTRVITVQCNPILRESTKK